MSEDLDVLGSPQPVRRTRRDRTGVQILVTGVAAVSVFVTGVAYAGYAALAPSGHAPEQALPAETVAFAKVDLDPSASQKIAVYRLSKRFPKTHVKSDRSVKDDLLADVFKAAGDEVNYKKDIKPWIGDRAGVGLLPGASGDNPHPVVAIQFHDKAKATKGIKHLVAINSSGDLFYAFSDVDDYLLLSDDQAVVDKAAHANKHLSEDSGFRSAIAKLDGDQIVTAWADLGKAFDLIPKADLQDNPIFKVSDLHVTGQYVLGLHAENDAVELDMHALGVSTGVSKLDSFTLGQGKGSDLVQGFPSDALGAVGVTGLGSTLADAYKDFEPTISDLGGDDALRKVAAAGIHLPGDLRTVLGSEIAGYVAGDQDDPQGVIHVKTEHAAAAKAVLAKVIHLIETESGSPAPAGFLDSIYKPVSGGYLIGIPGEALHRSHPSTTLGQTRSFKQAVPDAQGAPVIIYVNLKAIQQAFNIDSRAFSQLSAFGATMRSDGKNSVTRMRLTFR